MDASGIGGEPAVITLHSFVTKPFGVPMATTSYLTEFAEAHGEQEH